MYTYMPMDDRLNIGQLISVGGRNRGPGGSDIVGEAAEGCGWAKE